MDEKRDVLHRLVRGLKSCGFLDDNITDDALSFRHEDDRVFVRLRKPLDKIRYYSGRAGFNGLRVKHLDAVASSLGLTISLTNNAAHVRLLDPPAVEANVIFPSFFSSLFSSRPHPEPEGDDLREEAIWSLQQIDLERTQLEIKFTLVTSDAEESIPAVEIILELAQAKLFDYMAALKFLPKVKTGGKKALKPTLEELSCLLFGAGLIDRRFDPGKVDTVVIGKQDLRVIMLCKNGEQFFKIKDFLTDRRIRASEVAEIHKLSIQVQYFQTAGSSARSSLDD